MSDERGEIDPRTACAPAGVAAIVALLLSVRFDLSTEAAIQRGIEELFTVEFGEAGFRREARLSPADRPDFMIGGVAIEVKHNRAVKGATLRQLARYAAHDEVTALILVTGRAMDMPALIGLKPLHIVALGRAWL